MVNKGFAMRIGRAMTMMAAVMLAVPAVAALVDKKPPYFASIQAKEARMRTGPGRNYPITWKYVRPGLPVKVVENFKEKGAGAQWRKIEDPGGTQGWMQANLISETRTAMVMGDIAELRDSPRYAGKVNWRAAPGVVGRVSQCTRGWCYLDVKGRGGFVEVSHVWGVDAAETIE
jgi:SH3-like domain-containing protein